MAQKFTSKILNHPVAQNALSLFTVQIARYMLPIITIPYLARTLEPENWGLVIFAQASSQWLIMVLEYGFGLSISREIARYRDKEEQIAKIVTDVIGAWILLLLGSGLLMLVMGLSIPVFSSYPDFLVWAWLIGIFQGLSPLWYFQGIEQMQLPALLDFGLRIIATFATFIWIKSSNDGWKVLAISAITSCLSSGMMFLWIYREIPWQIPRLASALKTLRAGWSMFLFRCSTSLYTIANTFILGLLLPTAQVAFYGGAERISRTVFSLFIPIAQAFFPRINYLLANDPRRAAKFVGISMMIMGGGSLVLGIALAIAAPSVVDIMLGEKFKPVIPLLRVMVILIPLNAINNVLGLQWMVSLGLERLLNSITTIAGLINFTLALVLSSQFGSVGMAWTVVLSQSFIAIAIYIILWQKGLNFHQVWKMKTNGDDFVAKIKRMRG
ncbi:O-antigen transporter [Rivularia sp. IAM M-261]|nr:O-antigen transporter [Rivularia sp. IAM M-261]